MSKEKIEFELTEEYIELIKLLKLLNICESGSHAKFVVDQGMITCNNEVEFRKRKKLRHGDLVCFEDVEIIIK